jgi:hypothetical protein
MTSYPTPEFRRTALAPGILGAIVLIAGLALLDNVGGFLIIRFVVSILALIMIAYIYQARSYQARHWWWMPPLAAIAIIWNPIWPFDFHGQAWVGSQFVAAIVFIASGLLVKIRNPDDKNKRRAK